MYQPVRWRFVRYTNINTLETFSIQQLQPSHVMFCGYQKQGFKHVFLIGKDNAGQVMYIDPQANVYCAVIEPSCFQYIKDAEEYYILQNTQ